MMENVTTNPFAYNFQYELITVDLAGNGDYECPGCQGVLRKKYSVLNTPYFYHSENFACGLESYWHKIFKQVFLECKTIKMPQKTFVFDRVELEQRYYFDEDKTDWCIPDAIGYIGDKLHFIEFRYKHKVDKIKASKIIENEIYCIEIFVNKYPNQKLIKQYLMNSTKDRKFIFPLFSPINKTVVNKNKKNNTDWSWMLDLKKDDNPGPIKNNIKIIYEDRVVTETQKELIQEKIYRLKNHWTWNDNAPIYYDYKIPTDLKYPCFYYHQVGNYISYIKQIKLNYSVIWQENEWIKNEKHYQGIDDNLTLILWQRLESVNIENSQKNPSQVIIQHSDGSGSVYTFHEITNQLVSWILADQNGELVYECRILYYGNYPSAYKNSLGERWKNEKREITINDVTKFKYIWKKL